MRKLILAMQMSLDGIIEADKIDPEDLLFNSDDLWDELFEFIQPVDTMLLGRVMYPEYESYWSNVLKNPAADKNEIKYAKLATSLPHFVVSKTMEKANWKNTTMLRGDVKEEVSKLKQSPGKDIYLVGGAKLASSMINYGLIDAYRIVVSPVILGSGKYLFKDLTGMNKLKLTKTRTVDRGVVVLYYDAVK